MLLEQSSAGKRTRECMATSISILRSASRSTARFPLGVFLAVGSHPSPSLPGLSSILCRAPPGFPHPGIFLLCCFTAGLAQRQRCDFYLIAQEKGKTEPLLQRIQKCWRCGRGGQKPSVVRAQCGHQPGLVTLLSVPPPARALLVAPPGRARGQLGTHGTGGGSRKGLTVGSGCSEPGNSSALTPN